MKRFDDSTKKLIKNVAALLTSAVVLVAATIAWFSTGGDTSMRAMKGIVPNSLSNVKYYRLRTVDDVLQSLAVGTGSDAGMTFETASPTFGEWMGTTEDSSNGANDSTWIPTTSGNGAWTINSLYPGVYDGFRVDSNSNEPKLIIKDINCTDLTNGTLTDAQKEVVYKNVYLYAVAVKKTTTSTTENVNGSEVTTTTTSYVPFKDKDDATLDCIVCDSLYNLMDKSAANWSISGMQKIVVLDDLDVSNEDNSLTYLLFIGVPGASVTSQSGGSTVTDNLRNAHEMLRQIGAKLSFGPVLPFEMS